MTLFLSNASIEVKSFEEQLKAAIGASHLPKRSLTAGECQSPRSSRCVLCHAIDLDYSDELLPKNHALQTFWKQHYPANLIQNLVPSPLGREYRTVTKRRAFPFRGSIRLGLIAPTDEGSYKPFDVVRCAIEPPAHSLIYQKVQEILDKPYAQPICDVLSYVIIKGSYIEFTLILNVREISPALVHATNTLSKSLTHSFKEIVGIFLYEDSSDGRYYLGSTRRKHPALRKVFGEPDIRLKIDRTIFRYPPLAFSQVNQSILEQFVTIAGDTLELTPQMRLIDLYCGYGIFALCLAKRVRSVVGIEISADAVGAAIANARRQSISNFRFLRTDITPDSLHRAMSSSHGHDAVILDPPRSGTDERVIESIAARKPARVLHIFCNIDIMPAELKRWQASGYAVRKAIPFDMFPGTASVEMMVLLTPKT